MKSPRRLRSVVTLGPASAGEAVIRRLMVTADRFRLNGSHLDPTSLRTWLERLAVLFDDEGRQVPVVLDLQGAKMRIGAYPTLDTLPPRFELCLAEASDDPAVVPVPHEALFAAIRPGEILSMNDDRVRVRVEETRGEGAAVSLVKAGPLAARKGINRVEHPLPFTSLLPRDRAQIAVAEGFPFVEYAFSFVHTGVEAAQLREITSRRIAAKVERPEAMAKLAAIDEAFDEMWLCRGDLGAQAGIERLGRLQADFVAVMADFEKPAYLAGQVLEHMTHCPEPTRSEVVHLYDAAQAGWAGIVLSDETAVGEHPEKVADLLDALLAIRQ